MRTDAPQTIYLKDYQVPDYKVESISLDFRIFDSYTDVIARTVFVKNHEGSRPLVLNGEHMELLSVSLNDRTLDSSAYQLTEATLTVPCSEQQFTLEITTRFDPAKNTALEGLYKSGGTYCTQCEAEGFRRITYFPDRPDVMAVFTTRIEAGKAACPVLLSNGNLVEEGTLESGRHYTLWHDPFPKPCYLFALVAGDLHYIQDHFTTASNRKVDLRIYVRDGDQPQCAYAMEALKKSMKWDEDVYGREYQLDRFNIVAVSDFNMGAMENTSLNIFNTALVLAHPDTATDHDFFRVESVIAHEYFHNWTGNRITCRDWFQLSLKEGLTVYRDQEFSADMNSRAVQRIDDVQALRSLQFPEDSGPLAHPVRPDNYIEINNFYTTTVYEKGAEVIRMQSLLLGKANYRKATDLYFDRFDGQAVTTDDFVQCMSDASNLDLSQFKLWYAQAGTPHLTAQTSYNETEKKYSLTLSQSLAPTPMQPEKKPMHIPVAVGLIGPNGDEIMETKVLQLTESTQTFHFDQIGARPVPSILRNFSAPVRLTTDLSEDDLRFLMVHDTDGFNRWEASQTLTLGLMGRMLDAIEQGQTPTTEPHYLQTISHLLDQCLDNDGDKALLARMLSLPDYSIISQTRDVIDPDAIHQVVETIKQDVLLLARAKLLEIYAQNGSQAAYSPDASSMARRALKESALSYLTSSHDPQSFALASALYRSANNMTDCIMALAALIDTNAPERAEILADFYARFKTYPLVVDKWFSYQARAVRPSALDDIRALADHPDFTLKNPNRVRSLYGSFAMRNPVVFHQKSGEGYALFEKVILELDPINPQIASRLLTSLRDWKKYSPARQSLMKQTLEHIVRKQDLSPNSYEIASKTLG
jgi:aminopeptidase N